MTYDYMAQSETGAYNTQRGRVTADTPRDAETKVKALYSYPVLVTLTFLDRDNDRETAYMIKGNLV